VIAVDSNILVYAHRGDMPHHAVAREQLAALVASGHAWAVPWPCIHEFFATATNRRMFLEPSTADEALRQISEWMASPTLALIGETAAHWETLSGLIRSGRIAGGAVHDARIAAICLSHGVRELWTADRDFGRFPALKVRNPLVR